MKYSEAINMAIAAVSMDRMLDMNTKQEIIEALARAEELADIGEATEKFFNLNSDRCSMIVRDDNFNISIANNINGLLAWSEEETEVSE